LKPIDRALNKNIKIIGNSKQNSGRLTLSYVLGPLVFLLLACFIGWQIVHQPDWRTSLDQVLRAIVGPGQWRLWLVILLMPVNWGIEARKWQLALRPVGGISFTDAFRAVLTGTTLASFTPNRMGEYLGRILYVKEGHRIAAISLTMVCSISQLLITLVIGAAGLYYIHPFLHGQIHNNPTLKWGFTALAGSVGVLFAGLAFLYFRLPQVALHLSRFSWIRKIGAFIKVLENFDTNILLRILFLSFARYIVFMVQYSLVFPVFGIFLSFSQVWGGMSVVFLVMAVIPTFTFLTELGLRWGASIQVLEVFSANTVGIVAASFAIWLINLVIPALLGSLLIVSIKFFKSR
jgi:Lysylphosphatidylglycerol synthase TM region